MVQNNPLDYWDLLGLVTYSEAVLHWWTGDGDDYPIDFSEADPGMAPAEFDGFNDKTASVCSQKSDLHIEASQLFDNGFGHAIGRHTYKLSGTISYYEDQCNWEFSGTIESASGKDKFDFNPTWFDGEDNNRGFWAELSTWGGAGIGWLTDADDFYFIISGNRAVTDSGSCNE